MARDRTSEQERLAGERAHGRSGEDAVPVPERPPDAVPPDAGAPGGAVSRSADPSAARQKSGGEALGAEERRSGEDRRIIAERVEEERRQEARREADRAARARRQHVAARVTQGLDYVFYLLYGLLAIRFMLALLGASEAAGFVRFIHGITEPFYAPFGGIVARPSVNGGFLDFPLLIALLAYALLHLALRGLVRLVAGEPRRI
jgi:YggT family protein